MVKHLDGDGRHGARLGVVTAALLGLPSMCKAGLLSTGLVTRDGQVTQAGGTAIIFTATGAKCEQLAEGVPCCRLRPRGRPSFELGTHMRRHASCFVLIASDHQV